MIEQAAAAVEEALPNAFKGDAHALLMAVYKNTDLDMQIRIDAAKAAVRYEKPALQAVHTTTKDGADIREWMIGAAQEER